MARHVIRATRFAAAILARYRLAGQQEWACGRTRNISITGVLFEAAEPLHVESLVELTFHLREPLGSLPAGHLTWIGKVARHVPATEAEPYFGRRQAGRAALRELNTSCRDAPPEPLLTLF